MAAKTLLLHVCCGPCAMMPITRLQSLGYELTAWFMNPNIQPLAEYLRRREAAGICAYHFGIPIIYEDATWNITTWLRAVRDQDEPPKRCQYCCEMRIKAAFRKAEELGFDCVTSSLLYSIYQPHEVIKACGEREAQNSSVQFVYQDFRIDWQAGIDASTNLGLYRQPYCGCVYSESERYQKKLRRLISPSNSGPKKD